MVTQSLLNQYRREVEGASNDARNYLTAMCEAYIDVNPNATVADMRKFAIETIQDGLYLYGDQAKVIANDFFDRLAQQEGSKATAEMFDSTDADMVEQKVRYYAKAMAEGDTSKFIKDVSDLTGFYVKREAFCNMAKNCKKSGIRYARVPSGRETCAFCFMLASRGFVYWTEADAGEQRSGHEYHANCDCIIVPGFHKSSGVNEDTQIEGYKPSEMRDRYKKCYDAINPNGTWDEVYKQWKNSETEETWEKFRTKALLKEINTRDWGWLWDDKPAEIDKSVIGKQGFENLRKHEKETWNILAEKHGLGFKVLPEDDDAPANIDALYRGELWELKNPQSGKHAVEDRIRDGCKKWKSLNLESSPKLIISNSKSSRDDWEVFQECIRRCEHYGAEELIFVSNDGEKLYRWKK